MTAAVAATLVTVAMTVIGAIVMMLMVNYLPESPIRQYIASTTSATVTFWTYCNGLAWFLPIDRMLAVLETWVLCLGAIVVYKVVYELISKVLVE